MEKNTSEQMTNFLSTGLNQDSPQDKKQTDNALKNIMGILSNPKVKSIIIMLLAWTVISLVSWNIAMIFIYWKIYSFIGIVLGSIGIIKLAINGISSLFKKKK